MVTKDGFSIAYEVFSGSTFEGHTFIPSIQKFVTKNKVKDFTIPDLSILGQQLQFG